MSLIPVSGRSPGGGNGNPFQYSCQEISWKEEPGGLQSMGSQSQMQLSTHPHCLNIGNPCFHVTVCALCMLCHTVAFWLLATPWTIARQPPLSMEFFRPEYWSKLPSIPSDLPNLQIEYAPSALASGFFHVITFLQSSLMQGCCIIHVL